MAEKLSRGRQKMEMKKIPMKSNLQVTFSKRKSGLFKKASELCILCGAKVAILAFSPGGKIFSFGHPDVHSVLHSLALALTDANSSTLDNLRRIEADHGPDDCTIQKLNLHLADVLNQLEAEKRKGEVLSDIGKWRQAQSRWEAPVGELSLGELQQLKAAMEDLQKAVVMAQAEQLLMEAANNNPSAFGMAVNGNRHHHHHHHQSYGFERKAIVEAHGFSAVLPQPHNFGYGSHGFF